jgi:3' terminal RNA ribose 2'-O-methyltransferase Hen1
MDDDFADPDEEGASHDAEEEAVEKSISLSEQRTAAVVGAIRTSGARRVLDLGCGEGKLVGELLREQGLERVVGVDVSYRALEIAARRLHLDDMTPRQRARVDLIQGSLTYRDKRLAGFDVAAVVEVIEHFDPSRLGAFERVLFAHARPNAVIVTTPNFEYNVCFDALPAGQLRHRDHRFEWTRAEFASWCRGVAERHGFDVEISEIGTAVDDLGAPSQMAVFHQQGGDA